MLLWLAIGCVLLVLSGAAATAQSSASSDGVNTGPVPTNAVISGNGWLCRAGFALTDGRCDPVVAPANAIVAGNGWRRMPGFAQDGDSCVRLIPPYGYVQENEIKCSTGYALQKDGRCAGRAAGQWRSSAMAGVAATGLSCPARLRRSCRSRERLCPRQQLVLPSGLARLKDNVRKQ